jgi:hypothetical protein
MPNVPGLYLMLEEFPCGSAWRETDETAADVSTVVDDLLTGQYEQPPRIVAFNPIERWSSGASEEIADELDRQNQRGTRSFRRAAGVPRERHRPQDRGSAGANSWQLMSRRAVDRVRRPGLQSRISSSSRRL